MTKPTNERGRQPRRPYHINARTSTIVTRAYVLVTVMPRYSRSMVTSHYARRPRVCSKLYFNEQSELRLIEQRSVHQSMRVNPYSLSEFERGPLRKLKGTIHVSWGCKGASTHPEVVAPF